MQASRGKVFCVSAQFAMAVVSTHCNLPENFRSLFVTKKNFARNSVETQRLATRARWLAQSQLKGVCARKGKVMKRYMRILATGVVGAMTLSTLRCHAHMEVGVSLSINAAADFYTPMASYGTWVEVGTYGRCWHPARVEVGWRPYSSGEWVWTDCGWYWESDEPWAWACYHYGYWVTDPVFGWVWIPGTDWGPAWVTWRSGGGYIGWAPMAPAYVTVQPEFVFVSSGRFHSPVRPSTVVVQNTTIINKTTVINNIHRETRTIEGSGAREVVVNEGPGVDVVRQATGQKLKPVPIHQVAARIKVPAELRARGREMSRSNNSSTSPTTPASTGLTKPPTVEKHESTPRVEKHAPIIETPSRETPKNRRSVEKEPKFTPIEPNDLKPEQRTTPRESVVTPEHRVPPGQYHSGKSESATPSSPPSAPRPQPSSPPARSGRSDKDKDKPDADRDEGHGRGKP